MKLYLSSYRIPTPKDLFGLAGKNPKDIKIALIPNAKDYYAKRARDFKIKAVQDEFNSIGVKKQRIVDLRGKNSVKLLKDLQDQDVVWCMGGNTFCLMEEISKSGFDAVIKELIKNDVVYGGESAGAIVAGATLRGVEYADEPEFAEETVWKGMKLINKIIVPHVGSEMFGDGIDELVRMHKKSKNLIKITDYQAFMVDGDVSRIVGAPA